MKRDWELIRALLLEIEALGHGQHFHPQPLAGHGLEMVSHNLHLMCQAGLAECTPHHPWNGDPVMIAKGSPSPGTTCSTSSAMKPPGAPSGSSSSSAWAA